MQMDGFRAAPFHDHFFNYRLGPLTQPWSLWHDPSCDARRMSKGLVAIHASCDARSAPLDAHAADLDIDAEANQFVLGSLKQYTPDQAAARAPCPDP